MPTVLSELLHGKAASSGTETAPTTHQTTLLVSNSGRSSSLPFSFLDHFKSLCSLLVSGTAAASSTYSSQRHHGHISASRSQLYASLDTFYAATMMFSRKNSTCCFRSTSHTLAWPGLEANPSVEAIRRSEMDTHIRKDRLFQMQMLMESHIYTLAESKDDRSSRKLASLVSRLLPNKSTLAPSSVLGLLDVDCIENVLFLLASVANLDRSCNDRLSMSENIYPFKARINRSPSDLALETTSPSVADLSLSTAFSFDTSLFESYDTCTRETSSNDELFSLASSKGTFSSPFQQPGVGFQFPEVLSTESSFRAHSHSFSRDRECKVPVKQHTSLYSDSRGLFSKGAVETHTQPSNHCENAFTADLDTSWPEQPTELSWEKASNTSLALSRISLISDAPPNMFESVCAVRYPRLFESDVTHIPLSQEFVIKCMLKAAIGVSSPVFLVDPIECIMTVRLYPNIDVFLTTLSAGSLKSILCEMAEFGSLYLRLQWIIVSLKSDTKRFGLTGTALSVGLTALLKDVQSNVDGLQGSELDRTLHIIDVVTSLSRLRNLLSLVISVFNCNIHRPIGDCILPTGLEILTLLYDTAVKIDMGCVMDQAMGTLSNPMDSHHDLRDTLLSLFQQSSLPFLSWADCWLGLSRCPLTSESQNTFDFSAGIGKLKSGGLAAHDPFDEFFIAFDEKLPISEDQGGLKFKICHGARRPPSFVPSEVVQNFLEAGVALRIIDTCHTQRLSFSSIFVNSTEPLKCSIAFMFHEIGFLRDMTERYERSKTNLLDERIQTIKEDERRRIDAWQKSQAQLIQYKEAAMQNALSIRNTQLVAAGHRKQQLKLDIEAFLTMQTSVRAGMLEIERNKEAQRILSEVMACAKTNELEANEAEVMKLNFETRMKLLQKAEERVVWRQKRLDLTIQRLAAMESPWIGTTGSVECGLDPPEPDSSSIHSVPKDSNEESDRSVAEPLSEHIVEPKPPLSVNTNVSTTTPHLSTTVDLETSPLLACAIDGSEEPHKVGPPVHSITSAICSQISDVVDSVVSISSPYIDNYTNGQDLVVEHAPDPPSVLLHNTTLATKESLFINVTEKGDTLIKDMMASTDSIHSSIVSTMKNAELTHNLGSFQPFSTHSHVENSGFFCIPDSPIMPQDSNDVNDVRNGPVKRTICPLSISIDRSLLHIWRAQERIISRTALMVFFCGKAQETIDIRFHINILTSYYCLRDGQFIVSLKDALFGDGHAGADYAGRGLGLNGNGRWPVDISLASHALGDLFLGKPTSTSGENSRDMLDFHLSTLLKIEYTSDMPGPDITATNSMSFFRLVYTPPPPIHIIITPECTNKLEMVFSWLLRLVRADTALNHATQTHFWQHLCVSKSDLDPAVLKMSIAERMLVVHLVQQAKAFLKGIMWYSFDVVVGSSCTDLQKTLSATETLVHQSSFFANLDGPDSSSKADPLYGNTTYEELDPDTRERGRSIRCLSSLQSTVLKTVCTICSHLFLDQQHRIVRSHLDHIVQLILKLSRYIHGYPIVESLSSLQASFQVRHGLLMTALLEISQGQPFIPNMVSPSTLSRPRQPNSKRVMELAADLHFLLESTH
ncbi:hypothetical protein BASA50_000436 [Batrachochytrium salamandrivorans]|uniref:Spc7 kinetochore protein domain-containing protein n=1 Tax=Batrachochytrium salamandrivorans TaxID=1357716 RepID=A0ABQ8ETU7_9FUNG|nr:hypothetical protein BASA50_000436 [Batrachochytrium salamandrivorans]